MPGKLLRAEPARAPRPCRPARRTRTSSARLPMDKPQARWSSPKTITVRSLHLLTTMIGSMNWWRTTRRCVRPDQTLRCPLRSAMSRWTNPSVRKKSSNPRFLPRELRLFNRTTPGHRCSINDKKRGQRNFTNHQLLVLCKTLLLLQR